MESPHFPQRYGQIEEAYRQQEWSIVMDQGQTLLEDLEMQPEAGAGLKPRLQLLMAHALLYGFNDTLMAEDYYTKVAGDSSESDLQPVAEAGIQNCRAYRAQRREDEARAQADAAQQRKTEQEELISTTANQHQSQPASPMPGTGAGTGTGAGAGSPGPVMPWLTQTAADSALVSQDWAPLGETLIPEIVEEPELLELHHSGSSLAEEVDLMVRERLGVGLAELGDPNRHSIESVAFAEQAATAEKAEQPGKPAKVSAHAEDEDEDLMAGLLRVVLS
jgi:hypothetical protein